MRHNRQNLQVAVKAERRVGRRGGFFSGLGDMDIQSEPFHSICELPQ